MSEALLSRKLDAVLAGCEFFSLNHISVPARFVEAASAICKAAEDRDRAQSEMKAAKEKRDEARRDGFPQGETYRRLDAHYVALFFVFEHACDALDAAVRVSKEKP